MFAGRGATKRRAPLLSRSNSCGSRRSFAGGNPPGINPAPSVSLNLEQEPEGMAGPMGLSKAKFVGSGPGTPVEIYLPDAKASVTVNVIEGMTIDDVLTVASVKEGLSPVEHFVRIKKRKDMSTNKYFVPQRTDQLETYVSGVSQGFFCPIFRQVQTSISPGF